METTPFLSGFQSFSPSVYQMSDSENESDFASAESDQEDGEKQMITKEDSDNPNPQEESKQPTQDNTPANETHEQLPEQPSSTPVTTNDQHDNTQDTNVPISEKASAGPSKEVPPEAETTELTVETTVETEPDDKDMSPDTKSPLDAPKESGGGWGWGGWGNSLWSSVSTVTESAQALGSKVTSVIASVEEGLGLPSPTDLATSDDADEETELAVVEPVEMKPVLEEPHHVPEHNPQEQNEAVSSNAAYGGFLSGLASVVQSTGKGLMSGGLDALETLGKKTMDVLSEGDPGLRSKRVILTGPSSPTLSQLLKEAKNTPTPSTEGGGEDEGEAPLTYSRLFDEYHGVVYLEALELLSKECAAKVMGPSVAEKDMDRLREMMEELETYFQVEEEQEALDDDSSKLAEVLELFSNSRLPLKVDKLVKVSNAWRDKVEQTTPTSHDAKPTDEDGDQPEVEDKPNDLKQTLYVNGLRSLAELTSSSIELFRKISELTLLPDGDKGGPIAQAKKLNRLTVLVSSELDCLASVHSEAIAQLDMPDTNSSVTSLYLEASNSSTYVQDAFQLLLPVLKLIQIQQLSSEVPQPNVLSRT